MLAVPRVDGEYGSIGVIALIEKVGRLPSGEPAAVVRGVSRARIGSGVPGPGAALWVEATELDEPAPTGKAKELAREYKALVTSLLQQRGAWQVIDAVERMTDLSELADSAGYAPWLTLAQKIELLAAPDVTARLELLVGWVRDHLAEQEVTERINNDVREGLEKSQREFLLRQQLAAIRKELGEDEPDGSADYRSRVEAADLPEKVREAAMREVGKLERASDASPGVGLDPHLAGHRARDAVDDPDRGQHRPGRGPRGARRRPRRPDRREGPDPGVPGGAQPPGGPQPAGRRRSWLRCGARPRPARPGSARPASASRSRGRSAASSSGSPSAASATRRRSAATGAPTSARCPAGSSGRCARPVR